MAEFKKGDRILVLRCDSCEESMNFKTTVKGGDDSSFWATEEAPCGCEYWNSSDTVELQGAHDMDHLQVGDVLVRSDREHTVLGVLNSLVFFSSAYSTTIPQGYQTVAELESQGYTLKQTEPEDDTIELTLAEVAELKGVSVDKIRIKDAK